MLTAKSIFCLCYSFLKLFIRSWVSGRPLKFHKSAVVKNDLIYVELCSLYKSISLLHRHFRVFIITQIKLQYKVSAASYISALYLCLFVNKTFVVVKHTSNLTFHIIMHLTFIYIRIFIVLIVFDREMSC